MSKGDTPRHDREPRCLSCRHATLVQGYATSQQLVFCYQVFSAERPVPFPVYECSEYVHRMEASKHELEKMATIIENKDGKIGFRRLSDKELE